MARPRDASIRTRTLPAALAVITVAVALPAARRPALPAPTAPEGWSDPDAVDFMHTLLVLVGIPLLVFLLLITLAVYVPPIVRGERIAPAGARGRRTSGSVAARRRRARPLEAGATAARATSTGGASGRW